MPNHLASGISLCVLQRANFSVDWSRWGKPDLALTRQQNRPIFFSIVDSPCGRPVIKQKGFENPEISSGMSDWCACKKIDREADADR